MARRQEHHVTYKPVEWKLSINMLQHRTIARIQRTKANPMAYSDLTNFVHSLLFEWNRMRMELETGVDCRTIDFRNAKLEKRPKVSKKQLITRLAEMKEKINLADDPEKVVMGLKAMVDDCFKRQKKLKRKEK